MQISRKMAVLVFTFVLLCMFTLVPAAHATNGMNLEGYGPIATGMGGAATAYDNGTAAMMNNPATLGLMPEGDRLDVALGFLGPNVTSSVPGMPDAKSSANAFFMPAFGWAEKSGQYTYGVGVYAQGGMGTEYDANSFMAAGSGDKVMSQVSMGRVIVPLAYTVDTNLNIGASLDFVWESMDLKMALPGAAFGDMVAGLGGTQTYGTASGSMVDNLVTNGFGSGALTSMDWARFDFADKSDFSGKAKGTGFGGKIGATYKVSDDMTVGLAYHSKTAVSDLEANGATVSMQVNGPGVGGGPAVIPVTGKIKIKDFQWPQMIMAGMAYQASDKLLVVFDYKWINWANVMKNFKMTFTADANQASPLAAGFGLGGQEIDATLFQNWKDQNVFMLGAGYKFTEAFTGRAGVSIANNPIPDKYENPLFPAIIKNHVMLGGGYDFNNASSVNVSYTYAPEVKVTNGQGVTTKHSQNNAQVMYSYRF